MHTKYTSQFISIYFSFNLFCFQCFFFVPGKHTIEYISSYEKDYFNIEAETHLFLNSYVSTISPIGP